MSDDEPFGLGHPHGHARVLVDAPWREPEAEAAITALDAIRRSPQGECDDCQSTGWISSETGESIPASALGYRSDAVECMECSPQGEDHEDSASGCRGSYVR